MCPEGSVGVDFGSLNGRQVFSKPKSVHAVGPEFLQDLTSGKHQAWTHALAGIACSGARPMMSAQSNYVRFKALLARVFVKIDKAEWGHGPKPGLWKWADQFVQVLLPEFQADEMTFEDWLATMPSRRKMALELAELRYRRTGWRPGYKRFRAFVKAELLQGFGKTNVGTTRLSEMVDRIIQGPHDVTHVIAGRRLKPLVHRLKEIWTAESPIFYGSAKPAALQTFLDRLVACTGTYFWCDFTMFDATHSVDSWKFMARRYSQAGIFDPDFWKVFHAWMAPSGSIGPFSYTAGVVNASGRDDTALANGILNGFATFLSLAAAWFRVGLGDLTLEHVQLFRGVVILSVCGDDTIGRLPFMTPEEAEAFSRRVSENLRAFGFEAKFCMSYKLYDAVYLGHRPYPTATGWYWGKTIGRATYKMGWVVLKAGRDVMAHITGIADMHCRCSRVVPVLYDLAKKIVELRQGAKRTPVEEDLENAPWREMGAGAPEYDDVTMLAVADMYTMHPGPLTSGVAVDQCVTVADVRGLVELIRGISRLPCVVDHWLWRRMVVSDDL